MVQLTQKNRGKLSYRIFSLALAVCFLASSVPFSYGQSVLGLPETGILLNSSKVFEPARLCGVSIDPKNPLKFDFIVSQGDTRLSKADFRKESEKLISYFLAALTVPEKELWVNLSPYEADKTIPTSLGDTKMGRDLLAQDYILKQLTASLMYPEEDLGKEFWAKVYKKAHQKYGTTNIPISTFNKVWIVPEKAVVYEHSRGAVISESHLKVMLEEDYLALKNTKAKARISSDVVREVLIPEIEREVNQGKTFANLRQIYNSLILAAWYKQNLRQSLLGQVYADKAKTEGIDTDDKKINQKIYQQYLAAFKKGVYDYIRRDYDQPSRKFIRRKYFSGGTNFASTTGVITTTGRVPVIEGQPKQVSVNMLEVPQGAKPQDVRRAVRLPEAVTSTRPFVPSMLEAENQYRKPIIGGNLKREFTKDEIPQLLSEIAAELQGNSINGSKVDVFIAPGELHIERFAAALEMLEAQGLIPKGLIKLGAQNVAHRDQLGAFTGQHATVKQLKEYGVEYVLVGHSEIRRGEQQDGEQIRWRESNSLINRKLHSLLYGGLTPVVAFGESAEERAEGKEFEVVRQQVLESLAGITAEQILSSNLVLAYEPVWAIGKNALRAATKEEANTMHKFIRNNIIRPNYGDEVAAKIRIIYGGSVNPGNVAALVQERNIDGGLIGGAAKKGETFVPLIKKASQMRPSPHRANGRILYDALARQEARSGKAAITMCTNIRTPLSLDGVMQAAKETNSVVILQQAMSELGYTWPAGYSSENVYRFADEARKAAERNDFHDYVLKGDHVTVKVDKNFLKDASAQNQVVTLLEQVLDKKTNIEREDAFLKAFNNPIFMSNPNVTNAMKAINKAMDLVKAEAGAGYTVYALDASFMPSRLNVLATALLAGFIPENSSIEAEVGEIGGDDNSTVADALELVTGTRYKETIERDPKTNAIVFSELIKENGKPVIESEGKGLLDYGINIDRIALNNGTAHGNNYDKDNNLIKTQMNLRLTSAITEALSPYGISIVQHGVTGTPLDSLPALKNAGIRSAHVGTNWQNIVWETLNEIAKKDRNVEKLVDRMVDTLIEKYGEKYKVTKRESFLFKRLFHESPQDDKNLQRLIGKELKNILGQYKNELDNLPDPIKSEINAATKRSALEHFRAFDSVGVAEIVAEEMLRSQRDKYPLLVTSQTASELTALGLRGAYQAVLDIVGDSGKSIQRQVSDLHVLFQNLAQSTNQKEEIVNMVSMLASRKSSEPVSKDELKKMKSAIKDTADAFAKRIFERTAKEEGIILMVRVSEGFGRDAVAESLKANEVIVPDEIKSEARAIQYAIDAEDEFYTSRATSKSYPIIDVIVDVVEGTNQFVTNSGNKTLSDIPAYEAGATSVMVTGPGVRSLGNAPDGYVGQFITNLGEHSAEFNQQKSAGYSLKDPELYARHPERIADYLKFLAKIRNQKLEDIQEEVVLMDRPREAALINELKKLQLTIPGLKIVGKEQKGIADGTVAHGLKATMSKEMYESITGQVYGPHKTMITIGGSAEGFINLAVVGELKSAGAVGGLRVYSMNMNKDTSGQTMQDQSQRYAFRGDEIKDIQELRAGYGDAEAILQGEKLFTEDDVVGDVAGTFSFISTNGVFHQQGNRKVSSQDSITRVLKIAKDAVEIVSDIAPVAQIASLEPESGLAASQLGEFISQAAKVDESTPALSGRILYDALGADPAGEKAVTMCTNVRTPLSLDGIMQAAKETESVVILQQAISEFDYAWPGGYTPENTYKFAQEAKEAGERNDFSDYLLKADHVTVKVDKAFLENESAQREIEVLLETILAKKTNPEREEIFNKAFDSQAFMSDAGVSKAMKSLKKALEHVKAAVGAGYTVFALDASFMPMKLNIQATALLAGFIPEDASIEGEVGEIGGTQNSTPEEALEFVNGLRSYGVNIDRLAINNGTSHGNVYRDGKLVETKINLKSTSEISEAIAPYGIKIVQHGVTGTPIDSLPALRGAGITSAHVGTNWQNIAWNTLNQIAQRDEKVQDLIDRMVDSLIEEYGKASGIKSRKPSFVGEIFGAAKYQEKMEEFIGKYLKNVLGQYKSELDALPQEVKDQISAATRRSARDHFVAFNSTGTARIARNHTASSAARSVEAINQDIKRVEEQIKQVANQVPGLVQAYQDLYKDGKARKSAKDAAKARMDQTKTRAAGLQKELHRLQKELEAAQQQVQASPPRPSQTEKLARLRGAVNAVFGKKGWTINGVPVRKPDGWQGWDSIFLEADATKVTFGEFTDAFENVMVAVKRKRKSVNMEGLKVLAKKYSKAVAIVVVNGDAWVIEAGAELGTLGPRPTASSAVGTPGGINLDPNLIDLQIKRDGNGIALPVYEQPLSTIRIDGFIPVITDIVPITLPQFLGLGVPIGKNSPSPKEFS